MLTKLLIANRGEIAVRIIRACREIGISTVAVYSEADQRALHVQLADEDICIGPAPSARSYLNIPAVISAARVSGADAIHPGYGFLSQNAEFAAACERAGVIFVGPSPSSIARMGSKVEARKLMVDSGVPVVPGDVPEDQSDGGLRRSVERVGLPALVKASAGGGGKGMRRIGRAAEIDEAIQAARREAMAAFGDATLYVERLIDHAHHVEVQVFGDGNGTIVHLFERECSVQRRHQKVIEESPSPSIGPELRDRITRAGVMAANAVAYRNAGTVEFLVDVAAQSFYFLEMNTRLQVEHTVTEQVVNVDLVRAQLEVASGQPLPWPQQALSQRGHAIEARVYAEDPSSGFLPQAGRLLRYREPHWPGIRVDSGVVEGDEISVHYDPLLSKVIATAETRSQAMGRLTAALRSFAVRGIRTNIPFLLSVLEHPRFRAASVDTDFLDSEGASLVSLPSDALDEPNDDMPVYSTVDAGRTTASPPSASQWDPWNQDASPPTAPAGSAASPVTGPEARMAPTRATAGRQSLTAPMPATVLKVLVQPGTRVAKGQSLVILEAMKMELPLRALDDGSIVAVHCKEGQLVQADAVLVELE